MEKKNYRFLIVDDHMMMRNIVSVTLGRAGYANLDVASDGAMALDKITSAAEQSTPYDVVFLDWGLPNMDGYELLVSLRKNSKLENMAIVMVTSESEESNVQKALASGATAYVTKPFKPEKIIGAVEQVQQWRASKAGD